MLEKHIQVHVHLQVHIRGTLHGPINGTDERNPRVKHSWCAFTAAVHELIAAAQHRRRGRQELLFRQLDCELRQNCRRTCRMATVRAG
jgi:hypothetical protein